MWKDNAEQPKRFSPNLECSKCVGTDLNEWALSFKGEEAQGTKHEKYQFWPRISDPIKRNSSILFNDL